MPEWAIANRIEQVNGESGFVQVVDEIALTALQLAGEVSYRIRETDFLWTASVAVSDGVFRTRCQVKSENRFLDNDYVRSNNFWGTAQRPHKHPPKFLPLNAEVSFTFDELSNGANNVALYLWGKRADVCGPAGGCSPRCPCDRGRWGQGRGLFVHSTPKAGVAIGAKSTNVQPIKLTELHHFRATAFNAEAFNGGGGVTANSGWSWNLTRIDPRDERRAKIAPANMRAAGSVGTAQNPAYWPSPVLAHKASSYELDFADLANSSTNTVHWSAIGETLDDELMRKNC